LSLAGDTVVSRPASELDGLRHRTLPLLANEPFAAAAFDVELPPGAGRAQLLLLDGAQEHLVAEIDVAAPSVVPPRVLVDGSIVEIFDGSPTPYTTRAYPTTATRWLLRLPEPATLRAWHLGV
jgi:hypothetical protein